MLKRVGAAATVTAGLTGTAAASQGGSGAGIEVVDASGPPIDVTDVSGEVPLGAVVDDPGAVLSDRHVAALPAGVEPADVRLVVAADTDEVGTSDIKCNVGCCDGASCPTECDTCLCNPCFPVA